MNDKTDNSTALSGLLYQEAAGKHSPKKRVTAHEKMLRFEKMISGFSTALINTSEDNLEKLLNNWVKQFVEFLEVDRGIVIEYPEDHKTMHILFNYTVPEVAAIQVVHDYQPLEGVIEELEQGIIVKAEKIPDDLPPNFRGGLIEKDKTRSAIIVPLSIGSKVIGSLSFSSYRKRVKWSDDLVRRIRLIGEIIASAILRIRSHKNLLEEMERRKIVEETYSSVIKNTNLGFMIIDSSDYSIIDVNDEYCRMSGYGRDELVSRKIWDIDASNDPEKVKNEGNTAIKTESIHHTSIHKRRDGSLFDVEVSSTVFGKDGLLYSFVRDVTEFNRARNELEERLRFEELVSEFSAGLVNIRTDEFSDAIDHWLKKFVEFLEVDRGVVTEYLDENTVRVLTYYTIPGIEVAPLEKTYRTRNGEIEEFQKGIIIKAENIQDDLPDMLRGGIIERDKTKSLVIVPLSVGNQVIGSLTFASYGKERKWSDSLIRRIKLIGEIIANSMQRISSQQALSEEVERRKTMEERYSSILKTANVGFWISDRQQNILVVNDEYCRMSGYTRDELLSMKIPDLDVGYSIEKTKITEEILNTGATHHEAVHKKKDGSLIEIHVSSTLNKREKILFSFMRDITELNQSRREQEERLRFEEVISEFSATLINIDPNEIQSELENWLEKFVALLDVDRVVVNEYVNDHKNVQVLMGYDVAGVAVPIDKIRKTPTGVIQELEKGMIKAERIPEDLPAVFKGSFVEQHHTKSLIIVPLETGNTIFGNLTFISYKKERKWPDDLARRIKLIGEIIANALLRKRSSDALFEEIEHRRMLEERYSQIIRIANVGFWVCDLEGRILEVNDAYCKMSGYDRDELLGKTIEHIDASLDKSKIDSDKKTVLEKGALHHETSHIRKDGTIIDVAVSSNLIKEGGVIFSFTKDITELNRARKELEERLKFERLISEFSAALINIKPDDLTKELSLWLKKLVEFLNVDRGVVNEYRYDSNSIEILVDYIKPGVDAAKIEKSHVAPEKIMQELSKGIILRAEKIPEDLPTVFKGGRIEQDNSKSMILVPIVSGDLVIGNMMFVSYLKEQKWSDELFRRIKLIGEIVANAILRIRSHQALLEEMEQRKRLEERYATIIETAKIGFWITKGENILFVNDEVCRMSGYSRDELLRKKIYEIDFSKDPAKVRGDEQKTLQYGTSNHESKHIRKDGEIIDVDITSSFLEKEGVIFSFTRDITELNKTRRELEERLNFETLISEFSAALINVKLNDIKNEIKKWLERFAHLIDVDRFTIAEYQNNFGFLKLLFSYTNPGIASKAKPLQSKLVETYGFYKYLKYRENIKFESPGEIFPEDIKNGLTDIVNSGTQSFLLLPLRVGEKLLGSMSVSTLQHEKKWTRDLIRMLGLVAEIFANAMMRDKTDSELENYRKNLEEMVEERTAKLEKAQKELVISERMATLGKLTATVSHELRNPLGTIRTSIYALRKHLKEENPKALNTLNRVERNIIRCDLIIEDLLNYSRIQDLNLKPTLIDKWIEEIVKEMGFPEGIAVEKKLKSGATIHMDQERFRRCIINIMTNAYQAIQEKNDSEKKWVRITTYQEDKQIIVDISDNGVGFEMSNVKKIYEPLYSTKTFGIGLGIPITKQIIEQHGWSMEITGAPREGATVTIKIPVIDDKNNISLTGH